MPAYPSPVILDLDGTLVDSAPEFLYALNHLLDEIGRPSFELDEVRNMMGYGVAVLLAHALERTGPLEEDEDFEALGKRLVEIFFEHHLELSRPFPGVAATLETLMNAGVQLGLCTNKPHQAAVETLTHLGLDHFFGAVVGGGLIPESKPDAAHFHAVIARLPKPCGARAGLGASAPRAVMVGDTETDVALARNAKVPVIAVSYGYSRVPVPELGADLVIAEFQELPSALQRLA